MLSESCPHPQRLSEDSLVEPSTKRPFEWVPCNEVTKRHHSPRALQLYDSLDFCSAPSRSADLPIPSDPKNAEEGSQGCMTSEFHEGTPEWPKGSYQNPGKFYDQERKTIQLRKSKILFLVKVNWNVLGRDRLNTQSKWKWTTNLL